MKILSLDQARSGAWSIFDVKERKLVDSGTFSFSDKHYTFSEAIMNIEAVLDKLLNEHTDVVAVFLEDIQLRRNVQSFKKLAQLQGVLINLLEKRKYSYALVPPVRWQNYCAAEAAVMKEQNPDLAAQDVTPSAGKKKSKLLSMQFVRDKFGVETTNDNLADAICIGYYSVHNFEISEDTSDGTNGENDEKEKSCIG